LSYIQLQTAILKPHGSYKSLSQSEWRVYTDFQEALEKQFGAPMRLYNSFTAREFW
jgi:hypothetical protein